jgi:carbamate kinase
MRKTIVVAIGGNSLVSDEKHQSVPDQYHAVEATCAHLSALLEGNDGLRLVVTHGNGPQVGFILRRSELASGALHTVPLDSCVADTQGAIGYQIQCALRNALLRTGVRRQAVSVVTQTLVDARDPAFLKPNKPIGSFMTAEAAEQHRKVDGWDVVEDAGRGWRRVVSSPVPREILEVDAVRALLDAGFVVIAAGGGGIAVVQDDRGVISGAAAVVDKDLASGLLARQLGADTLVISTAVEQVCLDYGKPTQRALASMTLAEARRYAAEGHFKPGSMLPKIQAVVQFLEGGGGEAIITDPAHLSAALKGQTGTRVTA